MLIKCYRPNDITYKYIKSFDDNHYVIEIEQTFQGSSARAKCDYYDTDGAGQELLSLDDEEMIEIIQANDIEDCPTLKGFYIVRE